MYLSNDTNNLAVLAVCKNFILLQLFRRQETLCAKSVYLIMSKQTNINYQC